MATVGVLVLTYSETSAIRGLYEDLNVEILAVPCG